mmetsp:Transcript_31940/g.50945  ORF Transcript_31940/g.50945 Transcript_31940/m.50945 type:complete len:93 (+) Transcript_31940:116-394(+)
MKLFTHSGSGWHKLRNRTKPKAERHFQNFQNKYIENQMNIVFVISRLYHSTDSAEHMHAWITTTDHGLRIKQMVSTSGNSRMFVRSEGKILV